MKKTEYYNLREEFGVLDGVSKHYSMFNSFVIDYPLFRNKTIQECLDYFDRRTLEQEKRIEKILNVE